MRTTRRYILAERGVERFLLSHTSELILRTLALGSVFGYAELSEATGIPVNSLYVFCERLESACLIRRTKKVVGDKGRTKGTRTFIKKIGAPIKFPELKVIR